MNTLDSDGNGALTLDELLIGQDDPEVRELFTIMDLDETALREVFGYLDYNRDGSIYHQDFVEAFHKAQSQDWRVYLMIMKLHITKIHSDMEWKFDELRALIKGEKYQPTRRGSARSSGGAARSTTHTHRESE